MTYYRRQRLESFKRAMFAKLLNESTAATQAAEFEPQEEKAHTIWVPGVLTHAGLGSGQLAS
jgi:hypothetical protein